MFSAGFETAISVINRLQTNASDSTAAVVGLYFVKYVGYTFFQRTFQYKHCYRYFDNDTSRIFESANNILITCADRSYNK